MSRAVLVIVALALSASSVAAEPVLLRGGRVLPVSGPALERGDVLIGGDGRIVAVAPSVEAPAGARVVDVSGKVVTPGLVDAYSRLGLVEVMAVKGTKDDDAGGKDPVRAAFRAADGFHAESVAIPVARAEGVTSALVAPTGGLVSGQSAFVDLAGEDGATIIATPVAMHLHMGERAAGEAGGSRGALLLALRELFDDVRFYRERQRLFDENRSRTLAASRLDLEALAPVLDGAQPALVTVNRASDLRALLALAREQGLSPIVVGGAEAWREAPALAAAQVPVVVHPFDNLPMSFEKLGARADNAALLDAAGVDVILSTFHATDFRHVVGTLRHLAGNAVRAGLSHEAALRAVTLAPARALGQADRIGSLEPGKQANIVVWSGDPFELSTVAERVFIGGIEASLETRQKQLLERYRTLQRREPPRDPRAEIGGRHD